MFNVGDLIERTTPDTHVKKLGVVVMIGEYSRHSDLGDPLVKVCWADNYGTYWAQQSKLKLIAKGKR
jgi:hypothetical protein|tara:strand:- start:914 stop:1114 length:201 start_codon:yes stop_codon:yes gene_type:complete